MKLGSIPMMLAGATLALAITGGTALAHPAPQSDQSSQADQKKQPLYPNATREEPKPDLTSQDDADRINEGLNAYNAGNMAKAKEILMPYASGEVGSSKYAQALALQALANIDYKAKDFSSAITKLKKSLALDSLPNDTYFQLMYELAQFQAADKQYPQALDTLHKWRAEGKRETADSYGLEGILQYRLQNYKAAIAAIEKAKTLTDQPKANWAQVLAASYAETGQGDQAITMAKKQLAADPADSATRHNLVVMLMRANKYPEALKEMEQARSKGQLTTSDAYVNLAKLYLITGQNSGGDPKPYADKALAALQEGVSKGVVKPGYDYYKLKGNAALIGGDRAAALQAYTKGAALGHDGVVELRRAQLLASEHKYSAARDAARQALAKGTEHEGRAYMLIAEAERAMKNKPAAVKAMKKAAQDPETRSDAEAWLREAGH